jgi:hypothetical protein
MAHANFVKKKLKAYGIKLLILIFLLVHANLVFAETIKGLKLAVYIDDEIYVSNTYTSLFKITNLDHISRVTDHINLTLAYNITLNGVLIKQETVLITELNSYKTSNTGSFSPTTAGNYTISGWIINSTVADTNKTDDYSSKTTQAIDTSGQPCNISLNITTDKFIYDEQESVKFNNNLNEEIYPYTIEYWIEDFFGNVYKNKYNTTNTDQKSWKTEIEEKDKVLFVKSIVYPLCRDSNISDNYAEKMFVVKSNTSNSQASSADEKESSLEIADSDETASFGDIINVKVEAYRGDTSRYSISLYAEDNGKKASDIAKLHIDKKYSSFKGQIPLQLKPNCDLKLENGKYDIILEGLGEEDKKSIKLEGIKKDLCKEISAKSSVSADIPNNNREQFEYSLIEHPETLQPGQEFTSKVKLSNNDDQDYDIDVWSYVYRGSKCYSGERTANKQELKLEKGASKIVSLSNKISNLESGDYNLKIMINKDNQKTNKELTESIRVLGYSEENNEEDPVYLDMPKRSTGLREYNLINQLMCTDLIHYKETIYESKNEQIKKMIPIFFIAALSLILIILLWKR